MDDHNGHGGPLAEGVHDGQASADQADDGALQEIELDGSQAGSTACEEVEESWGNPAAYSGANRSTTPTRTEVEHELAALSRGPFQRILADYLGFSPTPKALRKFAERAPDKYISSLGVLAQLSGYKRDEVVVNNIMMIGSMSDYDIRQRRLEIKRLEQEAARLIEGNQQPRPAEVSRELDPDTIDVQAREVIEPRKD